MLEIHSASLQQNGALARVLSAWSKEVQSYPGDKNAANIETLDQAIVKQYGFVLEDTGTIDWLDVFVPGYAQCRVHRSKWEELNVPSSENLLNLAAKPQLERLCLDPESTDPSDGWHLGQIFPVIGASLVKVDIRKTRHDTDLTRLLPQGLLSILASCPRLRHLTVFGFKPPKEPIEIESSRIVARDLQWLCISLESELDRRTLEMIPNRSLAFETFFAELFPLIGSRLEHVEVKKADGIMPFTDAFKALIQSCPSLNFVALRDMTIGTLQPVTDAYREARTKLTTIRLDNCMMAGYSLTHFIGFLSDASPAVCATLDRFHIRFSQQRHPFDYFFEQFISLLEKNETLRVLTVEVPAVYTHPPSLSPLISQLHYKSGQWLPFRRAPVDLRSKCAFLSVMEATNLPTSAGISQLVFAFAAECARRECEVRFC